MTKTLGVVTGGGDCPGLNAVIRAVAKAGEEAATADEDTEDVTEAHEAQRK